MRILHIAPTDADGGADLGSYALHRALRAKGVDSWMLVLRKRGNDPTVLPLYSHHAKIRSGLRDVLDRLPLILYGWTRRNWWTTGWLPLHLGRTVDRIAPDVINFHWAGRGLAPISMIRELARYQIVWTLRDMWAFTGGCHYSSGCDGFRFGCGHCPQLISRSRHDISALQWRWKQRAWRGVPITFVAMSNWMAELARRAPLVEGNDVQVIANGVDTRCFHPADKTACRRLWRLPEDRDVILFGAIRADRDGRKGARHLLRALSLLAASGRAERTIAVVFGADSLDHETGMDVRCVGHLRDPRSMASLYAAADVMVVPSEEENMGKTALEALACGVPVVAFANTGQFDVVDHKTNGYLAHNLSADDLARGIAWCLDEARRGRPLRREARRKAERCFDIATVAGAYTALYHRLARTRKAPESEPTQEDQAEVVCLMLPPAGAEVLAGGAGGAATALSRKTD